MEQLGKKFDREAFLKGANNGAIKQSPPADTKARRKQFLLSLSEEQKKFLDELVEATEMRSGQLIFQAILFAKNEPVSLDFLNDYINFVYSKKQGVATMVQNTMSVHDSLKTLSKHYKEVGYTIGIKGVVILYLLNYAKNYLNQDISRFLNFG